ncbi:MULTISPECIES: HlyD family efflux transporter periplasmic adaptor subunit [unclassified Microbulbifer]|uniref:HlyD family secretion protein n=1 Tax=unclassified Microbulbifer TaxID=2619833 RepID=UPI0027E49BBF|nr:MULTISPECIES: HlyD family efflux transporter periplasmic adaptor subunit [unclassified Microbulbifer]
MKDNPLATIFRGALWQAALLTLFLAACSGDSGESGETSAVEHAALQPIPGELESERSVMVAPPSITRMWQYSIKRMVAENSLVEKGAMVIEFDDKPVREKLIEKQSELKQLRSELNNTILKEEQTVRDDMLAIEEMRAEFDKAQRRAGILDHSLSRNEREKAAIDFEIAGNDLQLARELAEMHKRTGALRISMARHKVERAEGEVAVLQAEVDKLKVKAPIGGLVQYVPNWNGEKASEGESVRFGQPVLQISDLSRMQVRAQADEVDKPYLAPGAEVEVVIDGARGMTRRGRIVELGRVVRDRASGDRRRVIDLLVGLEEGGGGALKPGMTASLSVKTPAGEQLVAGEAK